MAGVVGAALLLPGTAAMAGPTADDPRPDASVAMEPERDPVAGAREPERDPVAGAEKPEGGFGTTRVCGHCW
ncbi:hypothetical protein [Phytohabitans kaempferiae]|uniref:Uncharacterized protein n=1 Tax=Phytohabitans kaempferiae TaxID=1620943 RepID=A0ABV6MCC2_9ACTN